MALRGRRRLMDAGSAALLLAAAVLSLACGAHPAYASQVVDGASSTVPESTWYATQLHVHGWSNHNAPRQPQSMQYYSAWAASMGIDSVWWSDHNQVFDQSDDFRIDFSQGQIDTAFDISLSYPSTPPWYQQWYAAWLAATYTSNIQPAVSLRDGWLRMEASADGAPHMGRFQYRLQNYLRKPVAGHALVRPLMSDPVLAFDARLCGDSSPDAYNEVRVDLSWHRNGAAVAQAIVYRFASPDRAPATVSAGHRITVTVPLTTTHVELPLLAPAASLQDGTDNAVQDLVFAVGAQRHAHACFEISQVRLYSRQTDNAANFIAYRKTAQRYASRYGIAAVANWEQNAGPQHFNPFLPTDATLLPGWTDIYGSQFVPLVHDQGGLVALNHPFGADFDSLLPAANQDAEVRSVLNELLATQAWGADAIEIYPNRGQVDLAHHLKLWDLLAANGVPLCGFMTSDVHGGPLNNDQAALTSWIAASTPDQDVLLAGLRRCRVFFGSIQRFDGVLDLRLAQAVMGETAYFAGGSAPLKVIVDPLPAGAVVKLVQVISQPGDELTYVVDHQPIDMRQPAWIAVNQPGFVRVELWSARGEPLAFSNRIVIAPLHAATRFQYLPMLLAGATISILDSR